MLREEIAATTTRDLHELRRHHDLVRLRAGAVVAPHEAFGPAVLARPLRGVRVALVKELLHEARLILVGQQREDGRDLVHQHAVPSPERHLHVDARVAAAPLAGNRRVRVLRRAAVAARFLEQRVVVRLGRLERVRADDRCARIVAIAIAPGRRARRIVADRVALKRLAPCCCSMREAAVAAEVARIAPERAILVEILGREEIDRQRLDPVGAAPFQAEPMSSVSPGLPRTASRNGPTTG